MNYFLEEIQNSLHALNGYEGEAEFMNQFLIILFTNKIGMKMLRTSLYLAINSLAVIVCCYSCKTNNSLVLQTNKSQLYNDIIGVVIEFHKNKYGYSYMQNPQPCYTIDPVIEVKEVFVYFSIWNNHFLGIREKGSDATSFLKSDEPELQLDTSDLKFAINERLELSRSNEIGNQCIQYTESPNEEGVLKFSPIVKMNKVGYFHIALTITNPRGFIEYLYIVKRQKDGTFMVIQDIGDDWPGIGNTKELSRMIKNNK